MAAVASLAVVAILIAEQLVAAWIRSKRARFSVATLLVLMTACSVLFAVMRWSVGFAVALFVLTLTLVSTALEGKRRTSGNAAPSPRSH
jgi:cation transport ATPase